MVFSETWKALWERCYFLKALCVTMCFVWRPGGSIEKNVKDVNNKQGRSDKV